MSVVVAALVVLTSVGCGGSTDDRLPPLRSPGVASPVATPTLQLTAEEQQAVEEVRAVFDEFMRAYISLATSGEPPGDEAMRPVAVHLDYPLLGDINDELVDYYVADLRSGGKLAWTFINTVEVDLGRMVDERPRPRLHLRYCLDTTEWGVVDSHTGRAAPDARPVFVSEARYLGVVQATYFDPFSLTDANPRWYIAAWEGEVDQAC